jgi:hypothetical protein
MSRILDGRPYKETLDLLTDMRIVRLLLAETMERCIEIIDYKMPELWPKPTWEKPNYGREVAESAIATFKENKPGIPWSTAHWWGYRGPNLFFITFGELIYELKDYYNWDYDLSKAKEWLGMSLAIELAGYDIDYQTAVIADQLNWLHKRIGENN